MAQIQETISSVINLMIILMIIRIASAIIIPMVKKAIKT